MRKALLSTLVSLAERDSRIVLLTGDLGFMVLEPFKQRFPNRFFNMGIAEQNMIGVATGLAKAGLLPFVYSIVPFSTLRPFEFIRNGPVYHQVPVRIIGVGSGFGYGASGFSHYGTEDIGAMRLLPGMEMYAPANKSQVKDILEKTWDSPRPIYFRIQKNKQLSETPFPKQFRADRVSLLSTGSQGIVFSIGSVYPEVESAISQMHLEGVDLSHAVIQSIEPFPENHVVELLRLYSNIMVVEDHVPSGGIGSMIDSLLVKHLLQAQVLHCNIASIEPGISGSEQAMLKKHRLDRISLRERFRSFLGITEQQDRFSGIIFDSSS